MRLQETYLSIAQSYLREGAVDGLRVSTHPAMIDSASVDRLVAYGVSCVEIGVQSSDDEVLESCGRSYRFRDVEEAVALLKRAGLEVSLQLMPGLPGASAASDLRSSQDVVGLDPDFIRIYPTLVYRDTALAAAWEAGSYACLSLDEAIERSAESLALAQDAGIPVIRVGVHGAADENPDLLAGPVHPSFGDLVHGRSLAMRVRRRAAGLDSPGALRLVVSERDRGSLLGPEGTVLEALRRDVAPAVLDVSFSKELDRGAFVLS
jgi:histone acetyltransferase (RNA polymerase elongator complex component)